MRSLTIHNAVITLNGKELSERVDVTVEFQEAKMWDITPPLGWNWDSNDWRIYNFVRDLDSHGGVVRGGLFDYYVLIRYDKRKPSKSLIISEKVPIYEPGSFAAAQASLALFAKELRRVGSRAKQQTH